jgi:metaxin
MYLTPNFRKLTVPCYITTQTTIPLIRHFLALDLQNAAKTELLKHTPVIDEAAIYSEAGEAFKALDTYFKLAKTREEGRAPTTLLDAAVFAYTYLLLELRQSVWEDKRLVEKLNGCEGLRVHKETIRKGYFRARPPAVWKRFNEGRD